MIRTLAAGKVSEILHFPEDLCTGRASYSPMTINDIVSGIKATGGITVTGVFDDLDHIEAYCNYVPEVIDYRSIGERVRELRKEKKLIQKDFGEKVGSSPSAIFKIEMNILVCENRNSGNVETDIPVVGNRLNSAWAIVPCIDVICPALAASAVQSRLD